MPIDNRQNHVASFHRQQNCKSLRNEPVQQYLVSDDANRTQTLKFMKVFTDHFMYASMFGIIIIRRLRTLNVLFADRKSQMNRFSMRWFRQIKARKCLLIHRDTCSAEDTHHHDPVFI